MPRLRLWQTAGRCASLDCHDGSLSIPAGGVFEQEWSGHFLADDEVSLPVSCRGQCSGPSGCRVGAAAPDGEHTLTVDWHDLEDLQSPRRLDVKFTLPAEAVTATIAP